MLEDSHAPLNMDRPFEVDGFWWDNDETKRLPGNLSFSPDNGLSLCVSGQLMSGAFGKTVTIQGVSRDNREICLPESHLSVESFSSSAGHQVVKSQYMIAGRRVESIDQVLIDTFEASIVNLPAWLGGQSIESISCVGADDKSTDSPSFYPLHALLTTLPSDDISLGRVEKWFNAEVSIRSWCRDESLGPKISLNTGKKLRVEYPEPVSLAFALDHLYQFEVFLTCVVGKACVTSGLTFATCNENDRWHGNYVAPKVQSLEKN